MNPQCSEAVAHSTLDAATTRQEWLDETASYWSQMVGRPVGEDEAFMIAQGMELFIDVFLELEVEVLNGGLSTVESLDLQDAAYSSFDDCSCGSFSEESFSALDIEVGGDMR